MCVHMHMLIVIVSLCLTSTDPEHSMCITIVILSAHLNAEKLMAVICVTNEPCYYYIHIIMLA